MDREPKGTVPVEEVVTPLLIGRKEYVSFPEWQVRRLRVKVDTGAFSSVLDVADYELHREGGQLFARLSLCLNRKRTKGLTVLDIPVLKMVGVTNSTGGRQERPLLETLIRLGPVKKCIRITVANRAGLRCRMLLGREALAGSFIVDVSKKYLLESDPNEKR